jgi:hypothetical protein
MKHGWQHTCNHFVVRSILRAQKVSELDVVHLLEISTLTMTNTEM